jgi:hypothetical protein
VLPAHEAWKRLAHIQLVVRNQPELASAVRCLTLLGQLELTAELLTDAHGTSEPELPLNVIPFRPRRSR